jgi:Sulfotransferase domain
MIYKQKRKRLYRKLISLLPKTLFSHSLQALAYSRIGLISTMPRSGTWYNRYFLFFYDRLLRGENCSQIMTGITKKSPNVENAQDYRRTMGIDIFFSSHFLCPGFATYHGKYRESWDALQFYVEGFDGGKYQIQEIGIANPFINPKVRIVYVYRNPLDQAVSFFHHSLHHKDDRHRYYTDGKGQRTPILSVKQYIHETGIEAYIKQFFTYYIMRDWFPDNILTLKYEDLIRDPNAHFKKILHHFGHIPTTFKHQTAYKEALRLSSKDSMIKVENSLGRSLGDDQQDKRNRHIRDGSIGRWKEYLTDEDCDKIEERLQHFGLTLTQFEIG